MRSGGRTWRFVEIPRWGFLAALVYAPWAFGSTGPAGADFLARALLLLFGSWLVANLLDWRLPHVHPFPLLLIALLLAQGWTMAFNARAAFDTDFNRFFPLAHNESLPAAMDRKLAQARMLLVTGLLGAFCLASDLVQERKWQSRLAATIGLGGTTLILYGLILRMFDIRMILWRSDIPGNTWPFATYLYHGNAGAYINLVWPVAAAFAVLSFQRRAHVVPKALWVSAAAISAAGIFVNASKASTAIGSVLLLIMICWAVYVLSRTQRKSKPLVGVLYTAILGGALLAVAWSVGWDVSEERWSHLNAELAGSNARFTVDGICLAMLHDAGRWGFGPGTFAAVFPFYTFDVGNGVAGFWRYAHDDYLQTVIEWGSVGAALWGLLFFGGILAALIPPFTRVLSRTERALLVASTVALIGVAFHAAVDFPLQVASIQLYVVTFLGVAWGSRSWKAESSR